MSENLLRSINLSYNDYIFTHTKILSFHSKHKLTKEFHIGKQSNKCKIFKLHPIYMHYYLLFKVLIKQEHQFSAFDLGLKSLFPLILQVSNYVLFKIDFKFVRGHPLPYKEHMFSEGIIKPVILLDGFTDFTDSKGIDSTHNDHGCHGINAFHGVQS